MEHEDDVRLFFEELKSAADRAHRELTEKRKEVLIRTVASLRMNHDDMLASARQQARRGSLMELVDLCDAADEMVENGCSAEDLRQYLHRRHAELFTAHGSKSSSGSEPTAT